jgi:hypothetical protein
MRRAVGLEAVVVDNSEMLVPAVDPVDTRAITAKVAGPAALLVAKCHKIGERLSAPGRLQDKDAHDTYRLLAAIDTDDLHASVAGLLGNPISANVTRTALTWLDDLFAAGPDARGSIMAGRAEEGLGDPAFVAAGTAILAADLIGSLRRDGLYRAR